VEYVMFLQDLPVSWLAHLVTWWSDDPPIFIIIVLPIQGHYVMSGFFARTFL